MFWTNLEIAFFVFCYWQTVVAKITTGEFETLLVSLSLTGLFFLAAAFALVYNSVRVNGSFMERACIMFAVFLIGNLLLGFLQAEWALAAKERNSLVHALNGNIARGVLFGIIFFAVVSVPVALFELYQFGSWPKFSRAHGKIKATWIVCWNYIFNSKFAFVFGLVFFLVSPVMYFVACAVSYISLFFELGVEFLTRDKSSMPIDKAGVLREAKDRTKRMGSIFVTGPHAQALNIQTYVEAEEDPEESEIRVADEREA